MEPEPRFSPDNSPEARSRRMWAVHAYFLPNVVEKQVKLVPVEPADFDEFGQVVRFPVEQARPSDPPDRAA